MTAITIVGRLTDAPELRFTPSGAPVANFTVAVNRRKFDKQRNEWTDAGTDFYRCSIWRDTAENVAESLTKGVEVIVTGDLISREYETREGEKRTVWEVNAEHVGPSLRWASAKVTRAQKTQGQARGSAAQDDPWATPAGSFPNDEPPF